MKVSLNLAQYYSNVDLKAIPREELVERVGLQLGAVEDVVDYAPRYKGITVVKVVSCEKHPNADKLSVCAIDDGGITPDVNRDGNGLIEVVCGAPNVHADMWAAWIPPGATVPSTLDKDPFVLEARELRGVVSNGMLASAAELDISDDHSGILEIDSQEVGREPEAGEPLSNYFGLDDFVIDCENKMFTHRPDCFGNLGVARELAGISGMKFESPQWYMDADADIDGPFSDLPFESRCETELVSRFTARVIEGVSVRKSPLWLQASLRRVGMKPINNLVDWTNYYMHLTGQPTHAFDYDKIKALSGDVPTIFPRLAKKGEKLTLLGGKSIELDEADLIIATDKQPVALAGIMGGADTEVDEHTKNIIIECATFDMYAIRRSSMRHGLFTDASTRFTKGQSPYQNLRVLHKLVNDITAQTGAKPGNMADIIDCDNVDAGEVGYVEQVEVTVDFINDRLGSDLTAEQIKQLLENVELKVDIQEKVNSELRTQNSELSVTVPFWRMDIAIAEDIVEEVGRLYGFGNLPVALPPRPSKPAAKNVTREFKQQLRAKLAALGANEVLTYSFVHGDLLRNTGTDPDTWAYHLRNAISPDLQYYRPSLMPSLLQKVHGNIKAQAGQDDNIFALFELGKAHVKGEFETEEPQLPKQMARLGFVVAADVKAAKKYAGAAYYHAKKYLDQLTDGQAEYTPLETTDHPLTSVYQPGRSAIVSVDDQQLGVVGEFNPKARKTLKLPAYCAGFEVDTDLLRQFLRQRKYVPLSSFPSSEQDLTLEIPTGTLWSSVRDVLEGNLRVLAAEDGMDYAIEPLDIYQPEGSDMKRLSFRVRLTHHKKTMKTEEVNGILDKLAEAAGEKLQANRI